MEGGQEGPPSRAVDAASPAAAAALAAAALAPPPLLDRPRDSGPGSTPNSEAEAGSPFYAAEAEGGSLPYFDDEAGEEALRRPAHVHAHGHRPMLLMDLSIFGAVVVVQSLNLATLAAMGSSAASMASPLMVQVRGPGACVAQRGTAAAHFPSMHALRCAGLPQVLNVVALLVVALMPKTYWRHRAWLLPVLRIVPLLPPSTRSADVRACMRLGGAAGHARAVYLNLASCDLLHRPPAGRRRTHAARAARTRGPAGPASRYTAHHERHARPGGALAAGRGGATGQAQRRHGSAGVPTDGWPPLFFVLARWR